MYERRPIEIAPHDRLLLTANRQESGLRVTNGEIVNVSQMDEHRRLHLEDGRVVPSTYKHFDYGYAVTAHRSQRQSVDAVVIAGETMSRELFYVAASRGREHLTVITNDKPRLEESVGRSGARLSASELVRTMPRFRLGPVLAARPRRARPDVFCRVELTMIGASGNLDISKCDTS